MVSDNVCVCNDVICVCFVNRRYWLVFSDYRSNHGHRSNGGRFTLLYVTIPYPLGFRCDHSYVT